MLLTAQTGKPISPAMLLGEELPDEAKLASTEQRYEQMREQLGDFTLPTAEDGVQLMPHELTERTRAAEIARGAEEGGSLGR